MGKEISNAKEANIFSSSHHLKGFKGYFSKLSSRGECPWTPLVLQGYRLRAPLPLNIYVF